MEYKNEFNKKINLEHWVLFCWPQLWCREADPSPIPLPLAQKPARHIKSKSIKEKETGFPTWCLVCMYVLHVCVCNSQQTILLQAGEKQSSREGMIKMRGKQHTHTHTCARKRAGGGELELSKFKSNISSRGIRRAKCTGASETVTWQPIDWYTNEFAIERDNTDKSERDEAMAHKLTHRLRCSVGVNRVAYLREYI